MHIYTFHAAFPTILQYHVATIHQSEGVSPERDIWSLCVCVCVCLLVAVGHGSCWLVVAVVVVGVILCQYHLEGP